MDPTAVATPLPDDTKPSEHVLDVSRKVFISYAREDNDFALKLVGELRKKIERVWIDTREISVGQDWTRTVEDALRKSTEFVLILSPDATESEVVRNEVALAKYLGIPIRPVLRRECEPLLLIATAQYIDFREWSDEGLQELLKRPAPVRTSWRRIWIRLKTFYRPLLALLALIIGISTYVYFWSESKTSLNVTTGDASGVLVHVRNRGGRPSTLVGSSFKLHFGRLPIETEPLVPIPSAMDIRVPGHGEVSIRLRDDERLTPMMRDKTSRYSLDDIRLRLAGAKITLRAEVKESDDRVHTLSYVFSGRRIAEFVLDAFPYVPQPTYQ